jgi:hypothetical protein
VRIIKLGIKSNCVQIDVTAIARGRLGKCPTQLDNDTSGITWLVGFIQENIQRLYHEIVETEAPRQ